MIVTTHLTTKRSSIWIIETSTLLGEALEFCLQTFELNIFFLVEFYLNIILISKQSLLFSLSLNYFCGDFLRHGLNTVHNGWWKALYHSFLLSMRLVKLQ